MDDFGEFELRVLDRVVGAADMMLALTMPLPAVERRLLCKRLGERSAEFRRAYLWVQVFRSTFALGLLLGLSAALTLAGNAPMWVPAVLIVVALVIVGVPAIGVYKVAGQALDVAVGAYLVVSMGSDDENY